MTDQDLDLAYTAVCHALAEAGPQQAQRLLAMLCLALLVRFDRAEDVLPVIESVRQRAAEP
ncbi:MULTISPECIES: hypothetical protein [Ramlibacter]|uniref:DUF2783 domain-containing protein n=1 Tax=Ramlibacter pinisoli TaxID=2682844 RepID=A0A6N8J1M2_9BURK|nr:MULTISPECIES: hypothetical protein [Ramlibacter]MBA2962760.1 hypothetical protein [Ramlibacter sp. CGMCC 1.13660]MVQ32702.1 hypothetical protein [Ramlibacter pinisoli]